MIDTTVKIGPTDTRVQFAFTLFPVAYDTVRITPLTDEARRIVKIDSDRYRLSVSRTIGADLYDHISAAGYSICEEILDRPDNTSKYDCTDYDAWIRASSNRPDYSAQPE